MKARSDGAFGGYTEELKRSLAYDGDDFSFDEEADLPEADVSRKP